MTTQGIQSIEIRMGRRKPSAKILLDGKEITRGVLDFSVDTTDDHPRVTLVVRPEWLVVGGESVEFITAPAWNSSRASFSRRLRHARLTFVRNLRHAWDEIKYEWWLSGKCQDQ